MVKRGRRMLDGQKERQEVGGKSSRKWALERTAPGPCRPQPGMWIELEEARIGPGAEVLVVYGWR